MTRQDLKNAILSILPIGTKIKRVKHIEANDAIIDALFYPSWGIPQPFLGTTVPTGYVLCNSLGQTVNATNCDSAFIAVIGTTYGGDYHPTTNPTGTIGIPYIQPGASLVQSGFDSDTSTIFTQGDRAGVVKHRLTSAESGLPAHNHPIATKSLTGSYEYVRAGGDTVNYDSSTGYNTAVDAAQSHNNMSPYFVVKYILRII